MWTSKSETAQVMPCISQNITFSAKEKSHSSNTSAINVLIWFELQWKINKYLPAPSSAVLPVTGRHQIICLVSSLIANVLFSGLPFWQNLISDVPCSSFRMICSISGKQDEATGMLPFWWTDAAIASFSRERSYSFLRSGRLTSTSVETKAFWMARTLHYEAKPSVSAIAPTLYGRRVTDTHRKSEERMERMELPEGLPRLLPRSRHHCGRHQSTPRQPRKSSIQPKSLGPTVVAVVPPTTVRPSQCDRAHRRPTLVVTVRSHHLKYEIN